MYFEYFVSCSGPKEAGVRFYLSFEIPNCSVMAKNEPPTFVYKTDQSLIFLIAAKSPSAESVKWKSVSVSVGPEDRFAVYYPLGGAVRGSKPVQAFRTPVIWSWPKHEAWYIGSTGIVIRSEVKLFCWVIHIVFKLILTGVCFTSCFAEIQM